MPLSDVAIRKIAPSDKPQRLFDGGGLYLEVSPSGGKWWRWKYRFAGKEKRLALGVYPETTLAEARARHAEARKVLSAGIDPGEQRKVQKLARFQRSETSFGSRLELLSRSVFGTASSRTSPSRAVAGNYMDRESTNFATVCCKIRVGRQLAETRATTGNAPPG